MQRSTAEKYARFAEWEATPESPLYAELAYGVSGDPDVLGLLDTVPVAKRQPNLLLAAVRLARGTASGYPQFRRWVVGGWPRIRAIMERRRTQTNEAARCAALLLALARIDGPLALLEVGASAGLCLYPDRYQYDYEGHRVGLADSPVLLHCSVNGEVPLPTRVPEVVWRGGVDLSPLDVRDAGDLRWLECLVWPEQEDRRRRLLSAAEIVAADPPTIVRGDVFDRLGDALALVPRDATLVLFHTAVAAYLSRDERAEFAARVRDLPARWVSQEGERVFSDIAAAMPAASRHDEPAYVLSVDGAPLAYTAPHGGWVDWFAPGGSA